MADIPIELAKTILEKLIDVAIAESRYLCCFTSIAEECEKEKEILEAKRSTVEAYVKNAKGRVEDIRSDVTLWQKQADDLIQVDTKTKNPCFLGLFPNCKWQYSKGKELADKTKKIRKLIQQSDFQNVGIGAILLGVDYPFSQDYISFKSRELKRIELLDALKDDTNYIVGLQGMGGTGKTTLAKEVGNELKHSKQFDQVIIATVSYTPDIKKVQDEIASPLGLNLKDHNESVRPEILRQRLTNGEKILLLLDDVWGHINFEKIGIPYADNHKGCKVLLTTRNLWVCYSLTCEKIIQLELLSEEDAWILFKKHSGITDTDSAIKHLLDHGRKITKECKGLPIAIATIASSLKGQRGQEEWKVALRSLQKAVSMQGVDQNLVEIYKCLRYSYDQLKNENAQKLFLMCSMFPEDTKIHHETLTRFGIGVGIFGEVENEYDEVRNQVVVTINKLIDSCLLLKAGEDSVNMHDLVREVALWIANKDIQAVNLSKKSDKSLVESKENIKYLSCEGKWMDIFSCGINGSKLEILNVYVDVEDGDREDNYLEVPRSFLEHVRGLRVLHLTHRSYWRASATATSLLNSIQSLTNLRSLFLNGLTLGDISVIGKLQSLETLELVWCRMHELPREISELKKLLLLKLQRCAIENSYNFEVIEGCSSLEELYIVFEDIPRGKELDLKKTLPALRRYYLATDNLRDSSLSHSASKCVSVSKIDAIFSKATVKYLVQTAEVLQLKRMVGEWRNLIPDTVSVDEGMNDLVELHLEDRSQIQCLIDSDGQKDVFSKLVSLRLEDINNLEELCRGPLPADFLKSLESLTITNCGDLKNILFKSKLNLCCLKVIKLRCCPSIVSLFQLSTCRSLVMLEELDIFNCKQLKSIIADERRGEEDTKACGPMFPKLKTLQIGRCSQMELLLPFLSAQDVPALEHVTIERCYELKYIFEQAYKNQDLHQQEGIPVLGSLKEMLLIEVPNFIGIFQKCSDHPTVKRLSPKAEIGSDLDPIKRSSWSGILCGYANKYNRRHKHKSASHSKDQLQHCTTSSDLTGNNVNHFATFEALRIGKSKVENIFCLNESFTLQNLREVLISECENLEVIFSTCVVRCLPQLKTLSVEQCEALKEIISSEDLENQEIMSNSISPKTCFPKLTLLVVIKCNKLKCVFPLSTSKEFPKLEFVIITQASELTQVFGHQNVEIPNLEVVIFANLQSLCQGIEFQTAKHLVVHDCPKLSLTSTSTLHQIKEHCDSAHRDGKMENFVLYEFEYAIEEIEKSRTQDTGKENSNVESSVQAEPETQAKSEPEVQAEPKLELTSSQVNTNQSVQANNQAECNQPENDIESNEFISMEIKAKQTLEAEHGVESKLDPQGDSDDRQVAIPSSLGVGDSQDTSKSMVSLDETHAPDNESKAENMSKENLVPETIKDNFPIGLGVQAESICELTSSHDEQSKGEPCSMNQNQPPEGVNLMVPDNVYDAKNLNMKSIGIQRNTEEGTTSTHSKSVSLSAGPLLSTKHKIYPKEVDIDVGHSHETSKFGIAFTETHTSVSPNDGPSMKASSITKEQISNTNNIGVSESNKPSPAILALAASHSLSMPLEGNSSQIVEDPSFTTSLVIRELEQLISNKHLDYENLPLLTDFLVKHPSVLLIDNALGSKYKGYAYSCLVELLKFLQTHSVLDVLGSSNSKFVELLKDVRNFGFDKNWFDDVERRALHPGLQFSKDALQKVLESKQQATKEVDGLNLKIDIMTQHVEDLKHQLASSKVGLENIIQNEAQMLEAWADLGAPIGY